MKTTSLPQTLGLCALGVLACLAVPRSAAACGGTFCDGATPSPMPVDQTGEDILFVPDGDMLEVHVRIQYTGAAERFAWMVPLPAIPEVEVGVDALFEAMSETTLPLWDRNLNYVNDNDRPGSGGTGVFVPDTDLGGPGGPPTLVFEDTVGAFEIVVLEGGNASQVIEFFIDNDYAFEDDAEPLIQEYLDEGFLMVGVKLTAGVEVEEIHPLVFRFVSDEPCIPIRLTSVAANDDMGIRAYFLDDQRWASSNYKHVQLNPVVFDWARLDFSTYLSTLNLAVDEAGGQAFVTEYADSSGRVDVEDFYRASWDADELADLGAREILWKLSEWGLINYPDEGPTGQVRGLLSEFITVPSNWLGTSDNFWYALMYDPNLFDPSGDITTEDGEVLEQPDWNLEGFGAAFEERVVQPARHAAQLFEDNPFLTRLHTSMSAHEMTLDPTFIQAPQLGGIREIRTAEGLVLDGGAMTIWEVPYEIAGNDATVTSELQLCVPDSGVQWPQQASELISMPRALRVMEVPPGGGPAQVVVDNDAEIRAALIAFNEDTPCAGTVDPTGEDEGEDSDSGSGEGESGESAGADEVGAASCACSTAPGRGPLGFGFGLLGLAGLGLVRRR